MPARGLLAVACLVLIALACISVVRQLERERRLLKKLHAGKAIDPVRGVSLDEMTADERDCSISLVRSGVLMIRQNHCYISPARLPVYRRKRLRLALSGALGALLLAVLVAMLILRR